MTDHRIIPRVEWGADPKKAPKPSLIPEPWGEVVIHTEAGPDRTPASLAHETAAVKSVERFHTNPEPAGRGWTAIAYSFLVSPSGRIFEGRGWGAIGAHTETRNTNAIGVCLLGHGDKRPATPAAIEAIQWLIAEGIRGGHLTPAPRIGTHAEYSQKGKTCPGVLVVPQLDALRGITATPNPGDDEVTPEQLEAALAPIRAEIAAIAADVRTIERHTVIGADVPKGSDPVPRRIIDSLARIEDNTKP